MSDYRSFVVPHDFSIHAQAALYAAADLGRRLGAALHLLHVVQPPYYAFTAYAAHGGAPAPPPVNMGEIREGALKALRAIADGAVDLPGPVEAHVVEGLGIDSAIRELAEELGADLIVMGTHGRTGLAHAFLGSVAERTLRRAPCPVLTVQAPDDDDGEGSD